jgi:DNA-binding IclR family transcriptional regulator
MWQSEAMADSDAIIDESEAPGATGGVMAIRLVLGVLELLAKRDSVGVTELARDLSTTKARVYRHLRTLVDQGYAVQDSDSERYAAGPRLIALARVAALMPSDGILRLARPTMMKLRDQAGHTVNFSLVYGDSASIVETLQGHSIIGIVMQTHSALPLHSTAAGKLLLAERLTQTGALPEGALEKFTDNTITDPELLRMELSRIQEQGWAAAPEETMLGINALSAPIRDHRGELVAMISVLSSIQFIPRQPPRQLIDATIAAAREISAALTL